MKLKGRQASRRDSEHERRRDDPGCEPDKRGMLDCELLELVPNERIVLRWRFVDLSSTSHGERLAADGLAAAGIRTMPRGSS